MGILVNKTAAQEIPPFQHYQSANCSGKHFVMTEAPHLIAKMVVFKKNTEQLQNFISRQVEYYYRQVPGFNIVFIEAGYSEPPTRIIKTKEIETALDGLCIWYYETYLKNNRLLRNKLKIKP